MKIAWFCIPAHGHTNPTLGLVRELCSAGHEVYYFSFEMFKDKITDTGAVFIPCDSYGDMEQDDEAAEKVAKDTAFAAKVMVDATLALDEFIAEKINELKPDIIVSDSVAYWGKLAALKHKIPYICSTTTFAFNRYSAGYMKQGIGQLFKMLLSIPKINAQMKRLTDNGYPVKSFLDIVQNDNETNTIVYTSKMFQPCSETFSDRYHFIGPSMRPVTEKIEKTADKTVYISMGTINKNRDFYHNCIKVLSETDYQVIISMGSNKDHFEGLPENIQLYESVDQMAVLSIADAFITHCGMNSTSEGLYYCVPLILFPQTSEQEAVARRVEELKAGLRLPSIKEEDILNSINTVINDKSYKENATKISESFKQAGGIKEAVAFIEQTAKVSNGIVAD